MNDSNRMQESVKGFWDNKPCDSDVSLTSRENRLYYEEIEKDRYHYQGHINEIMDWISWRGKGVLEIGTGVGTDARNIIRRGGKYQGINVDTGSVQITQQALDVFNLDGDVKQCSATDLSFSDASFDVVYSFGVLHHIPDVDSALKEIFRVLKPGGELLIMVYNKSSINYKIEIMFLRKLFLRLLQIPGLISLLGALGFPKEKLKRHAELYSENRNMSDEEWLNRNTDGPDNPYSIVYDCVSIEELLSDFIIKKHEVFFFDFRHWGLLGKVMPKSLVKALGTNYGWHRIVCAQKPL